MVLREVVDDEQRETDFLSDRHGANESLVAEKKKDSRVLNHIQDFLADTSPPSTPVDGDTSAMDARRRMAAMLNEFDEVFESAGKAERSE